MKAPRITSAASLKNAARSAHGVRAKSCIGAILRHGFKMATKSLRCLVCNDLIHFVLRAFVEKRYLFFQHIVMTVGFPIGVARVRL